MFNHELRKELSLNAIKNSKTTLVKIFIYNGCLY